MCNQRNAKYAVELREVGGQSLDDVDYFETKKEALREAARWATEYAEGGETVRGGNGHYAVGEYHYIAVCHV